MKDFFRKVKFEYVVQSLVTIGIGVVLIVWAPAVIPLMARILAALLFVVGALFAISYFFKKDRGIVDSGSFAFGIIVAAVGVWIFLNPVAFTDFIPKIFGAFILLSGLRNLGQTISLVRYKYGLWWLSLVFALATVGLGAGLIFNASTANELIVRLIGGFLAYDGASNLWTASRLSKFEKAFDAARQESEAIDVEAEIVNADRDSAER